MINKLGLWALLVIIITNPASGQFILDGLDWIFKTIFMYGAGVNFAASGVLMVVLGVKIYQTREVTHIPKKRVARRIPVIMG